MPRRVKTLERFSDLTPDPENLNRGNARGVGRIEQSISKFGFARSIVADARGRVIAGNHVLMAAAEGNPKIKVVQVSGDTLVVVQRTDWGEDNENVSREAGLADNRTNELNWTPNVPFILDAMEHGLDLSDWYYKEEVEALASAPEPGSWDGGGGGHSEAPTCSECGQKIKSRKK